MRIISGKLSTLQIPWLLLEPLSLILIWFSLTLNGLDEDYHTLVTTLSCGSNLITFDDLHSKLIHYEQCLKFLKSKDALPMQHQSFATSLNTVLLTATTIVDKVAKGKGATTTIRREIRIQGVAIVLPILFSSI